MQEASTRKPGSGSGPQAGSPEDHPSARRLTLAALVGAAVAAVPYLPLYLAYSEHGEAIYEGLLPTGTLLASALLGVLLFTSLSRKRPDWLIGIAAAFVLAVVSALAWGFARSIDSTFSISNAGFVFAFVLLVGIAGASLATLITRLRRRGDEGADRGDRA